jgi:hypothetical protein
VNLRSAQRFAQRSVKVVVVPGSATEQVEAETTVFREGMASEMGLSEQAESRDAAGDRELMPQCLAYRVQVQVLDQTIE